MTEAERVAAGPRYNLARFKFGRFRLRIIAGRATHDPEKMVLPGAIYATNSDDVATVYALIFGWWDFHIGALLSVRAILEQETCTKN